MNIFQKILVLNDLQRNSQIIKVCMVLLGLIHLAKVILDFDRRTEGYINMYLFYPVLIIGLFNAIDLLVHHLKSKKNQPKVLLLPLLIPTYTILFLLRIILRLS
jgi:hypothetical protein